MNTICKTLCATLLLTNFAAAQNSFDTLDVNNIHAGFNAAGDMFYNINTNGTFISAPGNAIQHSIAHLWIGGYDNNGNLNVSAQTYRQTGTDFWPGPFDTASVYCPYTVSQQYNYVWNLSCAEVDSFIAYTQSPVPAPGYTVPNDIQTWPGNGNAAFGQPRYIAPFTDIDGDQVYNYQAGDYPMIRGSQSLFYVYNDSLQYVSHGETNSSTLGVQINAMPYAYYYPWDEALMNTIFVHYKITFYSTFNYTGSSIGLWSDIDFTGGMNKVASDSILQAAFHYNDNNAVAMYFLSEPMGGMIAYENNFSVTGNPSGPIDYYELMNRNWTQIDPLTYGGNGYNTGTPIDWMFTGNPNSGSGWLDTGGDRRILATTDSFSVTPGSTREFVIAFSFAHDTTSPYAAFTKAGQYISHVRQFYAGNTGYCSPQLSSVDETQKSPHSVFPNPAVTSINVTGVTTNDQYAVLDVNGQVVLSGTVTGNTLTLDVSALDSGVYFVKLTGNKATSTTRFVKMN